MTLSRERTPFFKTLWVWEDDVPRPGDQQMAVDDVLLESGFSVPLLRHYRWQGRWASFGRSQSLAASQREAEGLSLVRRPTGGGIVFHTADWTFSLIVPATEPSASLRPREFYQRLHGTISEILKLNSPNVEARLASGKDCRPHAACFSGPSAFDILAADGKKLCGGAQRRSRAGVLHQASIQGIELPGDFLSLLANALAETPLPFLPSKNIETRSAKLAAAHYGDRAWTERVP